MSETPNNEAIQEIKLKCLVLSSFFTDEQLESLLQMNEGKVATTIYQALVSAYTTAEASRSSGGVSESYALNWDKLLSVWKNAAIKEGYEDPGSGIFTVRRE